MLARLEQEKPDKVFFLGDAVGYGANPSDCLQAIAETADLVLAGNHDYAAAGAIPLVFFNDLAKEAIFWTRTQLSSEEKLYLKNLPVILRLPTICLAHASPRRPAEWRYILTEEDAAENFPYFASPVCFVGHSHQPGIMVTDQSRRCWRSSSEVISMEEGYRYIINVGSAGQPRDYNPKGAYCLYDEQKKHIQIHRFEYNIQKAQQKIIQAGLPSALAERLSFGI